MSKDNESEQLGESVDRYWSVSVASFGTLYIKGPASIVEEYESEMLEDGFMVVREELYEHQLPSGEEWQEIV